MVVRLCSWAFPIQPSARHHHPPVCFSCTSDLTKVHSLHHMVDGNTPMENHVNSYSVSTKGNGYRQFSCLIDNLVRIQEILDDSYLSKLENDILLHIGRLGALKLFESCLLKSSPNTSAPDFTDLQLSPVGPVQNVIVHSRKKEIRKLKRKRSLQHASRRADNVPCSSTIPVDFSNLSRSELQRLESELATGVREVANLQKLYRKIEESTGNPPTYARWAKVAGIDERVLLQRLHYGSLCSDKLLESTHSLVVYLSKSYCKMGVDFKALVQAGKIGVLLGAERFDSTRGCKFSTYAQYWIRKLMSSLVPRGNSVSDFPDISIETPEYVEQQMKNDIHALLEGLLPRERQVLSLRYGLTDGRCRSLSEIGDAFHVSKVWIGKIEKAALAKLRKKEILEALEHYYDYSLVTYEG